MGKNSHRIIALDVWRGIAVILVLFRHIPDVNTHNPILQLLKSLGWIGVDIFFVLSGYLISGLLFNELNKSNTINYFRFIIRRGFKIYPSFYLFIAIYFLYSSLFKDTNYSIIQYVGELFFLQNYLSNIHPHTWSLAIEEHFYLTLPLLFLLLKKQSIGYFISLFLIITIIIRLLYSYTGTYDIEALHYTTHTRIDSLLAGVLLKYINIFHYVILKNILNKYIFILSIFTLFLVPYTLSFGSSQIFSIGYILIYLSSAYCIAYSVYKEQFIRNHPIAKILSIIGASSYNIYLWHFQPRNLIQMLSIQYSINSTLLLLAYFLISVGIGVFITYAFEIKILNLRDRFSFSR